MKVLVLGGSGYIGTRLCSLLRDSGWAAPVSASSRRPGTGVASVRVDTRDPAALTQALRGMDAVVNCVAGDAVSIGRGAQVLCDACRTADCRHIVHLSSMSVYGPVEGRVDEDAPLDGSIGWYAGAKCDAEIHVARFAEAGGAAVIFRPGCVFGPASQLWVGRIGRMLRARRLGDLGVAGDGWSNLIHVDDVCGAIVSALRQYQAGLRIFNLAAPDSPRWNEYFVDLAVAIGATPVRRIAPAQLRLDAWLFGPPLKVAQKVLARLDGSPPALPDPLPPGLLGLWERHLLLDASRAQNELDIQFVPYGESLRQSAAWFLQGDGATERPWRAATHDLRGDNTNFPRAKKATPGTRARGT